MSARSLAEVLLAMARALLRAPGEGALVRRAECHPDTARLLSRAADRLFGDMFGDIDNPAEKKSRIMVLGSREPACASA
jgi:hypothetical protein